MRRLHHLSRLATSGIDNEASESPQIFRSQQNLRVPGIAGTAIPSAFHGIARPKKVWNSGRRKNVAERLIAEK
jgi:hypothetical protein